MSWKINFPFGVRLFGMYLVYGPSEAEWIERGFLPPSKKPGKKVSFNVQLPNWIRVFWLLQVLINNGYEKIMSHDFWM